MRSKGGNPVVTAGGHRHADACDPVVGMTATPRSPRGVHPSAKSIIISFSALISGAHRSGRRVNSASSTPAGGHLVLPDDLAGHGSRG